MNKSEAEEAKKKMQEETDRVIQQTGKPDGNVPENMQENGAVEPTNTTGPTRGESERMSSQVQESTETEGLADAIENDPAFSMEKKIKDKLEGGG